MLLHIARLYAHICYWAKERFDWNLRGLGYLARRIRRDAVIDADGIRVFFDHRIGGSYGVLLAGRHTEPETVRFVAARLERLSRAATVVDVGANVGDIALRLAAHPGTARLIAFEPHPVAAAALRRSVQLNGWQHVEVHEELVGDGGQYVFSIDQKSPNASAIRAGEMGQQTATIRLDDRLADLDGPLILVIDVEGAEPLVLQGAARTIARLRPLIVFEYNHISRRCYTLAQVVALLGQGYEIKRLRRNGVLDDDVEHAWNCVALPAPDR